MANTKISDLVSITGSGLAADDLFPVVDVSTQTTKKITRDELFSSVDRIRFDLTNGDAAPSEGTLTWDTVDKTLSLGLDGGAAALQIGQEAHYRVRNATGSQITNGSVVYATGSIGANGIITVAPFLANGTFDSHRVLGVATENIPAGADGLVTYFGKVREIDTSMYAEGSVLYASTTVAGGFTTVKPDSPNNVVSIAFVVSSKNNGTIHVRTSVEDFWSKVPATATSAGRKGDRAFDASYLYICVATNTWKRIALNSW